jgi:uncharacterized membrane protein YbhN (UPF0104 family)
VPARLLATCAGWIGLAIVLELLSIAGFVAVFKLVFGPGMRWPRCAVGALRGLSASSVLPAGGLIGPAVAATSVGSDRRAPDATARSAVALVILTNGPGVIVLVALGVTLSLGWAAGPHDLVRTLAPAGLGLALVPITLLAGRAPTALGRPPAAVRRGASVRLREALGAIRGGVLDARALLRSRDLKLLGAFAYYAFDNALLWAAFRAVGHAPAVSAVVMGYLVGSLGSVLPLPGGFGAVEGGLIGALVLYGAPAAPAAAAVLLYRAITLLLPTLLGAAAWGGVPLRWHSNAVAPIDHREQGTTTCLPTPSPSAQLQLPA